MARLLGLAALIAALAWAWACQTSASQRPVEEPAPTPVVAAPAPEPAISPSAAARVAPALTRTLLPRGRYWVKRPTGSGNTMTGVARGDEAPESTATTQTRCVPLDLARDGTSGALHIRDAWPGDTLITLRADPHELGHSWSLRWPRLAAGHVALSRHCGVHLVVEPAAEDAAVLSSNLGPIFVTGEACTAAPSHDVARCQGGDCTHDDAAARPFLLDECEPALAAMRADARQVLETSHAAAMRTLVAFEALARHRGALWERRDRDAPCRRASMAPEGGGQTKLSVRYVDAEGFQVTDDAVYQLAPAYHQAVLHSRFQGRDHPDGGGGMSGQGGVTRVGLYAADGAVLLGDRWLWLARARCEASP